MRPSVEPPTVSVVVVNWNGWRYLAGCLAALTRQTYADLEIVVVDNGSTDGSVERLRRDYPCVRLIENRENVGFAVANNQALAHCRGRYIALVNNDAAPASDWLATLVATLDEHPNAAGACGVTVALDEPSRVIFTTPKIDPWSARAIWVKAAAPLTAVDTLTGWGMLVRREVIDRLGFFDPAHLAYYEETDWCARALRAGYDLLFAPGATIAHKEQGSASADFHFQQMARNRLRFALRNFDRAWLIGFLPAYTRDLAYDAARNLRDGRGGWNWLLVRAVGWNIRRLPATLAARRRDLARIGPGAQSYNRSLPLRHRASDGRGGLR
jgi:GT2 family glycosyltransferase